MEQPMTRRVCAILRVSRKRCLQSLANLGFQMQSIPMAKNTDMNP